MPNNKYLRSVKKERQIVNEARIDGWIAARSAGSHSPYDCWLWNPKEKLVRLVQVKTKKGARMLIKKDEKVYDNVTLITATYSWE